jgi:hypothetical protein
MHANNQHIQTLHLPVLNETLNIRIMDTLEELLCTCFCELGSLGLVCISFGLLFCCCLCGRILLLLLHFTFFLPPSRQTVHTFTPIDVLLPSSQLWCRGSDSSFGMPHVMLVPLSAPGPCQNPTTTTVCTENNHTASMSLLCTQQHITDVHNNDNDVK